MIKRLLGLDKQEQRNYTDLVTQAILLQATTESAYSSALEVAAGFVSRAFASGRATGDAARYFDAIVLSEMGRDLIERGESAWKIEPGILRHLAHYDVLANGDYETATGTPIPGASVLHVRYHTDINTLRGIAPLDQATGFKEMLKNLENAMRNEAGSTVGYVLPVPSGSNVDQLKEDIKRMKGEIAVVETTTGGWDSGFSSAPRRDYDSQRLGANIPATSVDLYKYAMEVALTACGIPSELLQNSGRGYSAKRSVA